MARIVVDRVYATMTSLASVSLMLDGVKHGQVKSGATMNIETEAGAHVLRAHQWWQASNALSLVLKDDDVVTVELTTSQNPDDPADMSFLRSVLHPRSAYTLRLKSKQVS